MLQSLKIQNFALVDDLEISLSKGMSVLTGETGAGKSVIITALGLVLGDRADREHIRHGASKASVEATFSAERMSRQFKSDFAVFVPFQHTSEALASIDWLFELDLRLVA